MIRNLISANSKTDTPVLQTYTKYSENGYHCPHGGIKDLMHSKLNHHLRIHLNESIGKAKSIFCLVV
jgi:hypothetical protein